MKKTTRDTIIYSAVVFLMTSLGWLYTQVDFMEANLFMDLFIGVPIALGYHLQNLIQFNYDEMFRFSIPMLAVLNLILFLPVLLFHKFKTPQNFMLVQGGILIAYMVVSFPVCAAFVYL